MNRARACEKLYFLLDDADVVAAYKWLRFECNYANSEIRQQVDMIDKAWRPFFIDAATRGQATGALDPNFDAAAAVDTLFVHGSIQTAIFAEPEILDRQAEQWRASLSGPKRRLDLDLPLVD